jgi:hypothetical protein
LFFARLLIKPQVVDIQVVSGKDIIHSTCLKVVRNLSVAGLTVWPGLSQQLLHDHLIDILTSDFGLPLGGADDAEPLAKVGGQRG